MTLQEILAKKATAKGIKITPETDKAALAATIKATLDATAPKIETPATEPRELAEMEPGEQVPMDHPQDPTDKEAAAWFTACHAFDSKLAIVLEPSPSPFAWIAVEQAGRNPILILRLPLLNRPSNATPF